MPYDPLARMQQLLRDLFQFDCQDLDFGIYRVLNLKRRQIEEFIDDGLPQTVAEAFARYAETDREAARRDLAREYVPPHDPAGLVLRGHGLAQRDPIYVGNLQLRAC